MGKWPPASMSIVFKQYVTPFFTDEHDGLTYAENSSLADFESLPPSVKLQLKKSSRDSLNDHKRGVAVVIHYLYEAIKLSERSEYSEAALDSGRVQCAAIVSEAIGTHTTTTITFIKTLPESERYTASQYSTALATHVHGFLKAALEVVEVHAGRIYNGAVDLKVSDQDLADAVQSAYDMAACKLV